MLICIKSGVVLCQSPHLEWKQMEICLVWWYTETKIVLEFLSLLSFWGDKNNSALMENLQIFQNLVVNILLDPLQLKPLHLSCHFHRCITIFKILNGFTDLSCHPTTNSLHVVHNFNMRHKNGLHLPRARTDWGKQPVFYHV